MGRLVRGIAFAIAASALLLVPASPSHAHSPPAVDGLVHVDTSRLGPRLHELRFTTPAVDGETRVRVIVPAGYDASTDRYPVLWLLHGGGGSFRDWTDTGQAVDLTAGLPVIVVMPDGGSFGGYSDWWNFGAGGPPLWETYHLHQLLPWIDAHYRTVAERSGRAIAGLSMGGGGAMHYAARHPDLFVGAAAFSGAVDTNTSPVQLLMGSSGLQALKPPGAQVGHRLTDEVRWRGNNPWDLAENLDGLFLQLDTGNGQPGGPAPSDHGDPIEGQCWQMMTNLHRRLESFGIPHVWNDYGPGGHSWWYWRRDLAQLLPRLMDVFAQPPALPAHVRYTSIDPAYDVYGWSVVIDRPALEFSALRDADAGGFTLQGSGRAIVTIPASYAPGATVVASIVDGLGETTHELVVDESGRVTVPVFLGTGNTAQQLSPLGNLVQSANAGVWPSVTAQVTLTPTTLEATPAPEAGNATPTTEAGDRRLPATGGASPTRLALAAAAGALVLRRLTRRA